jgi:hypothetical protein
VQVTRWFLIAAIVLMVLFGVSQFAIPPFAEHRVESRLTEGGGSADVSMSAFPAARLLFGHGSRISVSGNGLDLPLTERTDVFDKLDGFDRVDIGLRDFRAGPLAVRSFELTRAGSIAPYHLVSRSHTTASDLASYGASRLGLAGGPLLGFFAGQIPGGNRPIPIRLDMEMRSENGRVVVTSGGGTVAGYPTGPLAELITSTIAVRL